MPELPEVETTKRGLEPYITGARIHDVIIRRSDLRIPIDASIVNTIGSTIQRVSRRSKYLIFQHDHDASVVVHLGMSGSLRIVQTQEAWKKHDHFAWVLANNLELRYHDPRRFGMIVYLEGQDPHQHPLLAKLGPEPWDERFHSDYAMHYCSNKKNLAIKAALMDARFVVGVGNIYASESLFAAKISPCRLAKSLKHKDWENIIVAVREVLSVAIEQGGTTLRDFVNGDGKPGYFQQQLNVYNRAKQPCKRCGCDIEQQIIAQRSTYWCKKCQK